MATGSSLLAMAVTAAVGAGPGDEPISYQVRILTMDGLGWRSTYYSRLQPVARQGTSSVWTADRALADALARQAVGQSVAPPGTTLPGGPHGDSKGIGPAPGATTIDQRSQIHYVADMKRVADGPMNHASAVAFQPEVAQVEEGLRVGVSCRSLDQGVLAAVSIEEAHVKAIHTVTLTETLADEGPAPGDPKPTAGQILDRFFEAVQLKVAGEARNVGIVAAGPAQSRAVVEKTSDRPGRRIAVQVKVPEVAHSEVEGEWMVPHGGILLVSLGVETVADGNGMAVVRERVAVLEVAPGSKDRVLGGSSLEVGRPIGVPADRLAMPPIPGRSLPDALDGRGRLVELPPLPEALASVELDRIRPEPNQPSPQAPHAVAPTADPRLARTDFVPIPEAAEGAGPFERRAMPALPARSLPVALDPAGQVVDLPPLPEALASAELDQIKPEPNQPSPQSLIPASIVDPALARTAFVETSPASVARCETPSAPVASLCKDLIESLGDSRVVVEVDWDLMARKVTFRAGMDRGDDPRPAPIASAAEAGACSEAADRTALIGKLVGALAEMARPAPPLTLPSASYLQGDVQHFAPGPDFPSANTRAATQPARAEPSLPHALPYNGSGPKAPMLDIRVKSAGATSEVVREADLGGSLKQPGRTERVVVPLDDRFSLEIQATVVAAPPGKPAPK